MNYSVSMTEDEVAVLHALFYSAVGGPREGPRRHVESLAAKLPGCDLEKPNNKYRAAVRVGFFDRHVVIEENQSAPE